MKLSLLHEGHWKTVSGSGYTDPKDKETDAKERDLSFLKRPEDRQRFVAWGKKKRAKGPGQIPTD